MEQELTHRFPPEFVRRFLMHIVPKGLMRVRHYGFLANRCRRRTLESVRASLVGHAVN